MQTVPNYLYETLGIDARFRALSENKLTILPLFIRELYIFKTGRVFNRDVILLEKKEDYYFTADQYRKHIDIIEHTFDRPAILVLQTMEAYNRKRLIQKQVAFIIPGKQMFIPQLLIDFKEFQQIVRKKREKVPPATQCLLLFHLLKEHVEGLNLKTIAEQLGYTQMTITRAARDLVEKNIGRIEGARKKRIIFESDKKTLWEIALPFLISPVKRKLYLDRQIEPQFTYDTAYSALSHYTDLTTDHKKYLAISQKDFLFLKNNNRIHHINEMEGPVYLEIWKYAPGVLTDTRIVDPLSLYLAFQDNKDDRIELALEKLLANLW